MDEYEIPSEQKRAIIIISTYGTCQSKVRVGAGEGELFDTITGVRKGSIFPPTIHHVHELGEQRSRHNPRTSQLHTGYADDIAQTAASEGELADIMNVWQAAFNK